MLVPLLTLPSGAHTHSSARLSVPLSKASRRPPLLPPREAEPRPVAGVRVGGMSGNAPTRHETDVTAVSAVTRY